mmetsp:Transcript_4946/g.17678  ORF Transcript_4946/g.17678 Transcript_4946/m.17678 type:complete len:304 (-) Transcript_4946:82-993(-)
MTLVDVMSSVLLRRRRRRRGRRRRRREETRGDGDVRGARRSDNIAIVAPTIARRDRRVGEARRRRREGRRRDEGEGEREGGEGEGEPRGGVQGWDELRERHQGEVHVRAHRRSRPPHRRRARRDDRAGVRLHRRPRARRSAPVVARPRAVGPALAVAAAAGSRAVARREARGVLDPGRARGEGIRARGVRRHRGGGGESDDTRRVLRDRAADTGDAVFARGGVRGARDGAAEAGGLVRDGSDLERRGVGAHRGRVLRGYLRDRMARDTVQDGHSTGRSVVTDERKEAVCCYRWYRDARVLGHT